MAVVAMGSTESALSVSKEISFAWNDIKGVFVIVMICFASWRVCLLVSCLFLACFLIVSRLFAKRVVSCQLIMSDVSQTVSSLSSGSS